MGSDLGADLPDTSERVLITSAREICYVNIGTREETGHATQRRPSVGRAGRRW
jgi:hypothetical protein